MEMMTSTSNTGRSGNRYSMTEMISFMDKEDPDYMSVVKFLEN